MKRALFLLAGTTAVPAAAMAAPADSGMPGMDHSQMDHSKMDHSQMGHDMMGGMSATTDVAAPMAREGSGTAWLPDSSPMYMKMKMRGRDQIMLHGTMYPRYTTVGSDRDVSAADKGSSSRFDAPSMFMAMLSHPLDNGEKPKSQLGVRLMMSADPLLERGYGYPLLFQSGESYRGVALHDRQHPHDLFAELSTTYSRRIGTKQSAYLYLGYPGEPALGPPAYIHRISGMDFPDAPLGHHWEDATHITFGVATAGYNFGRAKIEASAFNGREPDENRYNFDTLRLNSTSARFSYNPGPNWALQTSYGYIKSPESLDPGKNQHRITASALYNRPLGEDANLSAALIWGQNNTTGEGRTNAYTLETALQKQKNTVYLRAEHVQKSGHELELAPADEGNIYGINALSIGYVRDLKHGNGLDIGLGAQVTLSDGPSGLNTYYGSGPYTGMQVFLRIRPSRMKMEPMAMGQMNMSSGDMPHSMPGMPMHGQ
jgi:hypothetical protein